ncbi:uncharacterized protein C8orf74 homolog isoform X2 [Brachyhypopomus gauderio]
MYSVQRGLAWSAVAQVANITKVLFYELKGLEKSEVISLIQRCLAQCQPPLPRDQHKALYDFIVETCVCNHRLYQAFLNGQVNLQRMHSHLEICAPPHPLPLSEGTEMATWEKQQALQGLKAAEAEKKAEIHRLKEQAKERLTTELQASLGNLSLLDRLSKQAVENTVRAFLQAQGDTVKDVLLQEIKAVQELLDLRLRQSSLLLPEQSSNSLGFSEKLSTPRSTKPTKK